MPRKLDELVIVDGSAVALLVSGALKAAPFRVPAKVPLKVWVIDAACAMDGTAISKLRAASFPMSLMDDGGLIIARETKFPHTKDTLGTITEDRKGK